MSDHENFNMQSQIGSRKNMVLQKFDFFSEFL